MTNNITIIHADRKLPLYCKYQSQYDVQPAYIELDCERRTLSADYNAEIGSGIPLDVFHHRTICVGLPTSLLACETVNNLLDDIAELAVKVFDGYHSDYDCNCNLVGILDDSAKEALDEIESICQSVEANADYFDDEELADWIYYNEDEIKDHLIDSDFDIEAVAKSVMHDIENERWAKETYIAIDTDDIEEAIKQKFDEEIERHTVRVENETTTVYLVNKRTGEIRETTRAEVLSMFDYDTDDDYWRVDNDIDNSDYLDIEDYDDAVEFANEVKEKISAESDE